MEKPLFFSGQDVTLDDVDALMQALHDEVLVRFGHMTIGGVVSGLDVTCPSSLLLSVSAGVALTIEGQRIILSVADTVAFQADDIGASVVVRWREGEQTDRQQDVVTGRWWPAATSDSYELVVVTTPNETDVVLAAVESIDVDGIATLTTGSRQAVGASFGLGRLVESQFLDDPSTGTVRHHINSFGTGSASAVNPHRQKPADLGWRPDSTLPIHLVQSHDHHVRSWRDGSPFGLTPGVLTGGQLSISALTVRVSQLTDKDEFVVAGTVVPTISPTVVTPVLTGLTAGCFTVVLRSDGVPETKPFLAHFGARTVTGVMAVNIDQAAPFPGTPTKILRHTVSGTTHYLQWDEGPRTLLEPPSDLSNGDQFYQLVGGIEAGILTVWVDYSALPGTSGLDQITINAYPDETARCVLGHVWYFSSTGPLGYGNEGVGGRVVDARPFGSIRLRHLDGEFRTLLQQLVGELRHDGWAIGGEQGTSPGGTAFVVDGGIVYVGGQRFIVPSTTLVLGTSQTKWIYVTAAGVVTASTSDPNTTGQRFARCYYVKTGPVSGFLYVRDERTVLPNVDNVVNLGCDYLDTADRQQIARTAVDCGPYGSNRSVHRGRTLIIESKGPADYDPFRLYLTQWSYRPYGQEDQPVEQVAGLEMTVNAKWVGVDDVSKGSFWRADDATHDAVLWGFDGIGWYQQVKRREELTAVGRAWADTDVMSVGLGTWSSQPFVLDAEHTSLALHPSEFTGVNGDVDIRERVPLGRAVTNTLCPQNLVRAWGMLNVTSRYLRDDPEEGDVFEVKADVVAGFNVGKPLYGGSSGEPNNTWKIPLLTRLLRVRDGTVGVLPDAAVVGMNYYEPQLTGRDIIHPKVLLLDDGNVTYVQVEGPVISGVGGAADTEVAFAFSFMVVGAGADEALPDVDVEVDPVTHETVKKSAAMPDSGWSRDRMPPAVTSGRYVPVTTAPVRTVDWAPWAIPTAPTTTGLPGAPTVGRTTTAATATNIPQVDDVSGDPTTNTGNRGAYQPGGGRGPNGSRTDREEGGEAQPGLEGPGIPDPFGPYGP